MRKGKILLGGFLLSLKLFSISGSLDKNKFLLISQYVLPAKSFMNTWMLHQWRRFLFKIHLWDRPIYCWSFFTVWARNSWTTGNAVLGVFSYFSLISEIRTGYLSWYAKNFFIDNIFLWMFLEHLSSTIFYLLVT